MNYVEVIERSIPGSSPDLIDHILWGRTPFPFKKLTARDLYKAATGYIRAVNGGKDLCDHCHRISVTGKFACERCLASLERK